MYFNISVLSLDIKVENFLNVRLSNNFQIDVICVNDTKI